MEEAKEELTSDEVVDGWISGKESVEVADLFRATDAMEIGSREREMGWSEKEVIE